MAKSPLDGNNYGKDNPVDNKQHFNTSGMTFKLLIYVNEIMF